MNKKIAVISAHRDAHIPFVEKHLADPFIIIDPYDVTKGAELSFHFDSASENISLKGIDLSDLHAIWYRKPQPIDAQQLPVPGDYKNYAASAIERLILQLLSSFPNARWVSDYYAQLRANNKTFQLSVARTCGFAIPPTVMTSNKDVAQEFIRKHGVCISKPLTTEYPKIDGKQKLLLTTLIDDSFSPKLDKLYLAPSIFQKAIDVDIEARVVIIGQCVFAAEVHSKTPKESTLNAHVSDRIRDNRFGHYEGSVHIEALNLPSDIAAKCIRHCQLLGLNFGAIDLIRDKAGAWWFLENNPNGQWAYVEDATGQPIGKAIADFLQQ